jgi:hypothetical protein
MPIPLPRFSPGDPATKALNADFLNNVVDRLTGFTAPLRTPKKTGERFTSTLEAYAVNNTAEEFPIYSIVRPTGVVPANLNDTSKFLNFQDQPIFTVDVPTVTSASTPFVCLEPISPNGGVGRVAVTGLVVCRVNVIDEDHEYANITPLESGHLTSGVSGRSRILWKGTGTGVVNAAVLLSMPSQPKILTDEAIMIELGDPYTTSGVNEKIIVPPNCTAYLMFNTAQLLTSTGGIINYSIDLCGHYRYDDSEISFATRINNPDQGYLRAGEPGVPTTISVSNNFTYEINTDGYLDGIGVFLRRYVESSGGTFGTATSWFFAVII